MMGQGQVRVLRNTFGQSKLGGAKTSYQIRHQKKQTKKILGPQNPLKEAKMFKGPEN